MNNISNIDERKLVAIMFADIMGFSRMMAIDEKKTLSIISDFENLCTSIINQYNGEIIKKVGDELFCEFASSKQAVDCAIKIQNAIANYNKRDIDKDFKLEIRIGIHVGDVIKQNNDIYGEGVNVASRIQPLASPGGISISGAVNDTISNHSGYTVRFQGKRQLKNIKQKHSIYEVITGHETETYKVKNKNILLNKNYYFIGLILIMLVSMSYYFVKEIIFKKEEPYSEVSNIIVPNISSRIELIPYLYNSHNNIFEILPLDINERDSLYSELLKKVKTNFYHDNNIYENKDIIESFESIGKAPPNIDTIYTATEAFFFDQLDKLTDYWGNPENHIQQILELIDDFHYSRDLVIFFYVYKYKKDSSIKDYEYYVIYETYYKTGSFKDDNDNMDMGIDYIETTQERLISDLIKIIEDTQRSNKYDDISLIVKSLDRNKVFIQLDKDDKVFSNTEYEAAKIISSDNLDSMDNYINEIKLFIECCKEKEYKEEDINCNGFYINNMIGYWDEREIIKLDSIKSVYSENNLERYTKTFHTIVEINEVYDSIAVGIIKNFNNNSCIKLRPGDILSPVK